MGGNGGKKASPNRFFPVISLKVETSPQSFMTFSFNPFATLL